MVGNCVRRSEFVCWIGEEVADGSDGGWVGVGRTCGEEGLW